MSRTSDLGIRELDHRNDNGIDVTLLWNPRTNGLLVAVEDARVDESFRLHVDAAHASDAFHHPYAYADRARIEHALIA